MEGLRTGAFVVLLVVFLLRMPASIFRPRARLAWLATGFGTCALLSLGTVIPQQLLDAALGNTNLINLAQNLFTTTAFWLVMQAAHTQDRHERKPLAWWPLAVALLSYTAPFFFIAHRGPTRFDFVIDHLAQTSTWLYASIYMAGIAVISISLVHGLRRRVRRPITHWLLIVGAILVVAACVSEIIFLTLSRFEIRPMAMRHVTYFLFDPLFYPGVILIVSGITSVTFVRWSRQIRLQRRVNGMAAILRRRDCRLDDSVALSVRGDALSHLYTLLIAIRDQENGARLVLTPAERRAVMKAEKTVSHSHDQPIDTEPYAGVSELSLGQRG